MSVTPVRTKFVQPYNIPIFDVVVLLTLPHCNISLIFVLSPPKLNWNPVTVPSITIVYVPGLAKVLVLLA